MALEDMELDVGGTKIKGVWIAIVFSFASTIGGGIWAASEFFSRLEALEEQTGTALNMAHGIEQRFNDYKEMVTEDLDDFNAEVKVAQTQISDAGIPELQGKLATLGTNLEKILERQQELLAIQERIITVEKQMAENAATMSEARMIMKDAGDTNAKLERIQREINDIWEGMDFLSNPYGG